MVTYTLNTSGGCNWLLVHIGVYTKWKAVEPHGLSPRVLKQLFRDAENTDLQAMRLGASAVVWETLAQTCGRK